MTTPSVLHATLFSRCPRGGFDADLFPTNAPPPNHEELVKRGAVYVATFAYRDGQIFAFPVDPQDNLCRLIAAETLPCFQRYIAGRFGTAEPVTNDSADWLTRLHALEDPRA